MGVGANVSVVDLHGATSPVVKNADTAAMAQPLKSLPSTEWPVKGTSSSCAPRICDATCAATEVGVRRSCAPERISVGTLGGASGAAGGGEASGQAAQTGIRPVRARGRAADGRKPLPG